MEKEQLIVGFILTALGGFIAVRPELMVKFQVWNQMVIMGAKYEPSRRTFNAMRIIGAILMVMGFANLVGGSGLLKQEPETGFCTQDALLCPDGSYVSRTGKNCAFTACGGTSFKGILKQNPGGFFLIMPSPDPDIGEVEYTMALEFKNGNVPAELVRKKVEVFGSFKEGSAFLTDRMERLPGDAGDATLGVAGVGESVFINGVRITLNKITGDSRCPVDVQCIQAGWVTVNVTLKSDTDKETREISSDKPPVAFDIFKISIESVDPAPVSTKKIEPADYRVTFRVR